MSEISNYLLYKKARNHDLQTQTHKVEAGLTHKIESPIVCPLKKDFLSVKGGEYLKKLTLNHVVAFEKELKEAGIENPVVGPLLLPDYSTAEVSSRRWLDVVMESE